MSAPAALPVDPAPSAVHRSSPSEITAPEIAAPDLVREAASARLRELVATRRGLAGGHHADLRAALGLARLTCSAGLAADLDDLTRRADDRACTRASDRAEASPWLDAELDEVRRRAAERVDATVGPAVRRVAARVCPGATPMPLPGADASGPDPGARRLDTVTPTLAEAWPAHGRRDAVQEPGSGPWSDPRLLTGLAGLPVLAAGGLGWSTALTVAGVLLLLGTLASTRSASTARARRRAETARAVAAAGVEAERELARRLIEVERGVGAALDRAVADRRALLDAEIAEVRGALR
ncbi:hypothetical protein EV383_6143 [Pseudonocardia sediminis]|uniref:Uncharacterized protein n=1 Tax=Pseudonocardia sediminis TaxID=1397368 RepID=A0A4Q7V6Q5_PSEST|nr:hypothetical protein [Pseudonocardia sediminis]RZT89184.1 hypothetical protein EV383_6143 [Pseudonocardia sediminis]